MNSSESPNCRRTPPLRRFVVSLFVSLVVASAAFAQEAREGRLVREKIHGVSLEKTLTGESADRSVSIYLPPSYDTSPTKWYPVVYLLHGITDTDETWISPWTKSGDPWQTVPGVMNRGIAENRFGSAPVRVRKRHNPSRLRGSRNLITWNGVILTESVSCY